MGTFIQLSIIPHRISPTAWEQVYEETLTLVDAFPFMDEIIDKKNNHFWSYADRTQERENIFNENSPGWHACGYLPTGEQIENFVLYRDLNVYKNRRKSNDNGEILLTIPYYHERDHWEKLGITLPSTSGVWNGKTQGCICHIPLLAIGCLISSRFPFAAAVSGDINTAQCEAAVNWANKYLKCPIKPPVTANMSELLKRLKSTGLSESNVMELFYRLTLSPVDMEMGTFLKHNLNNKTIYDYYRSAFKHYKTRDNGFLDLFHEYLEQSFSFSDLCNMLVCDTEGSLLSVETFLRLIVESKLFIEEKNTFDYTENPEAPESVEMQMSRIFVTLAGGRNKNVNAYIPLREIIHTCENSFSPAANVKKIINELLAEKDDIQDKLYDNDNAFFSHKHGNEIKGEYEKYDIHDYAELRNYEPGDTLSPALTENIKKNFVTIRTFANDFKETLAPLNKIRRENWFLQNTHGLLLLKDTWEHIFANAMDDDYIIRYYAIFKIDRKNKVVSDFVYALLYNIELLNQYWEGVE